MQYQVRTGPITNNAANFSPEMVQGNAPRRSRASQGPRIGLPGVVHVDAFPFESILGGNLDKRNHLTRPQHLQPAIYPHQAAGISPEMMAGAQGQTYPSPRILLGQRIPVPKSQPTHVEAPFTVSMTAGVTAPQPRILRPRQIELPQWSFVADFAFDSVLASCLDAKYRLTRPQHLAPISQTTHVAAAFTNSMSAGVTAPQPRILRPRQIDLPQWAFVQRFDFDSVLASCLDSKNHLTRPQHLPPIAQPTHVSAPFSLEMVSRVLDLRTRQTKPRQSSIADLVSIAPFSFESVLGSSLDFRNHLKRALQIGLPEFKHVIDFPFDSVLGSRLDNRNHLRNPYHVAPISQVSHVSAPITPDMFRGWNSIPPQLKTGGLFLFYATTGEDWGIGEYRLICAGFTITATIAGGLIITPTIDGAVSINPAMNAAGLTATTSVDGDLGIDPLINGTITIREC